MATWGQKVFCNNICNVFFIFMPLMLHLKLPFLLCGRKVNGGQLELDEGVIKDKLSQTFVPGL